MANAAVVRPFSRKFRVAAGVSIVLLALALGITYMLDVGSAGASGNAITISGADTLAQGLQDVYRLRLSDPAPSPNGLQVTLAGTAGVCVVAPTENTVGTATLNVTIPAGQKSASFVAQTVDSPTDTTCTVSVTATTPTGWTTPSVAIPVVQGKLRIRDLARHIGPLARNDPFFVDAGVPTANLSAVRYVQGRSKASATDLMVTVCSDNIGIGQIANVYNDVSPSGCQQNPIVAPFSRTVPGDFKFDPIAGNNSIDVNVTATTAGGTFLSDTQPVSVRELAVTIRGRHELGAGLQDGYTLALSDAATSNQTVTIAASDTSACVVGLTEQSLGTDSIQLTITTGHTRADFVVQGVLATQPGTPCVVTATAGAYGQDPFTIDVRDPGLRLRELSSSQGQFAPNDKFFVELGVADPLHRTLRYVQALRKGSDPSFCGGSVPCGGQQLPVTVSSSRYTDIGTIVNFAGQDVGGDGQETVYVPLTFAQTVPGDLAFDPIAGNSDPTHVTATAPGFLTDVDSAEKNVFVKSASLQIKGSEQLGSSLQDDYTVKLLDANGHSSTNVSIYSLSTAYCKVAYNAYSDGQSVINVTIDADHNAADFVVQAAEMSIGHTCHIYADAPPIGTAELFIDIVSPGIQIGQLAHRLATAAANDPFVVEVGLPNRDNTRLDHLQKVRKGSTIPITVCSSKPGVGTIVDVFNVDNGNDGCENDTIMGSFANNVPGNLKFDPLSTGTTIVDAASPEFITMDPAGKVEVRVGSDAVVLSTPPAVGSGLQTGASVHLTKPAGSGGVPVTITSTTPAFCRVALNATDVAATSITLTIAQGDVDADFFVAGVEGVDGVTCTLTATAPNYFDDTSDIAVQHCGFEIVGLDPTQGTATPPSTFFVRIGVPADRNHLSSVQPVRAGGVAVPVTVCSSNTTVAGIGTSSAACQNGQFNPGQSQISFLFAVNPNNATGGSTIVTANGGCGEDTQPVRVSPSVVKIRPNPSALGKDLQATYFLTMNNTGGATVTVHAEPAAVCVISTDPTVLGDGLDKSISIPPGSPRASFVVQALNVGTCTVTASGTGFPPTTIAIPVYYSRLRISGLSATMSFLASDDQFFVEIGPANPAIVDVVTNSDNRHGILQAQARRPGVATANVRVCSSDYTAAIVKDPLGSPVVLPPPIGQLQCVVSQLLSGQSQTLNFSFDPLVATPVTIFADVPGSDIDDTNWDINLRAGALNLVSPGMLGINLQDNLLVRFSPAPPDNTTVTATVSGPCGVSPDNNPPRTQVPATQITIPVPSGRSSVDFWVQSFAAGTCSVSVFSNVASFGTDSGDLTMDDPATQITKLDTTLSTSSPDEPFDVNLGVASSDNARQLKQLQQVRPANNTYPLPVQDDTNLVYGIPLKVCSSDTNVGVIVGGTTAANCSKGVVAQRTDTLSIFKFDAKNPPYTYVYVAEDGVPLNSTALSNRKVTVVQDTISIADPQPLGNGLQDDYHVVLSKSAGSNGTVTLTVQTTASCKVAASQAGPFGTTAQVSIPKGRSRATFAVQALVQSDCVIRPTIDLTGYTYVDGTIHVVQPALRIVSIDDSRAVGSRDDDFNVELGAAVQNRPVDPNPRLADVQNARLGGGQVAVAVCSSVYGVGIIVGENTTTHCKTVYVSEGKSKTNDGDLKFHAVAEGTTSVSAAASAYIGASLDVVVKNIVSDINDDPLGSGLEDQYVLSVSKSSITDIPFTISTNTSGVCKLARNLTEAGQLSIPVIIPKNRTRVTFYVLAAENTMDNCELVATTTASGVTSAYSLFPVVQPKLRIRSLPSSLSSQSPDQSFSVQSGIPGPRYTMAAVQAARRDGPGISVNVCSSYPGVGKIVGENTTTHCKPVPIDPGKSETAKDALKFDSIAAGTTTVSASATGFISDYQDVAVSDVISNINDNPVGAGLEDPRTLSLNRTVAQNTDFTVTSTDITTCTVATTATNAGSNAITVTVLKNHSRATFYVLGIAMGDCHLTASTTTAGIGSADVHLPIVMSALQIKGLPSSRSTQSSDVSFTVQTGVPNSHYTLADVQSVRVGAGALALTVCSSNAAVGIIVGEDTGTHCKTPVYISEGSSETVTDALKFHVAGATGTTTVSAAASNFFTDYQDVEVQSVVSTISDNPLGAGLQDQHVLSLSSTLSADAIFHITSNTTNVCLVAVNATDTGIAAIDLTVPKGRTRAYFQVHGIEGTMGDCQLVATTTQSGVNTAYADIPVVQAGLRITDLAASYKTTANDAPFHVEVGLPRTNLSTLSDTQVARCGGPGLDVNVCNVVPPLPAPQIGSIVGAAADGCKLVHLPQCRSITNDGDLTFRAGTIAGSTTVTATATGLISTDAASKDVVVSPATITLTGGRVDAIGAGLEDTFTVNVNPAAPSGGLPIHLASTTPALCLVARDEVTAGAATYDPTIAYRHTFVHFAIQALENVSGDCHVTASSTNPAYSGDEIVVQIRQSGLRLRALDPTTTIASGNDSFFIDTGVPKDNLSDLRIVQPVRPGGPGLNVTACSSIAGYGVIAGGSGNPSCKTVPIAAGESATATNDLQFTPAGVGTTTVTAGATGFIRTDAGSVDVVVAAVALSIVDTGQHQVGAGLMDSFTVKSSATVGAATTVTITSLTPGTCYVAPDETTASGISTPVTIALNHSSQTFTIHGIEGVTGQCKLKASNPSFSDGFGSFDIVQAALTISYLGGTKTASSSDDAFYVNVGIPKPDLSTLQGVTQKVRTGSLGLLVTACSSDPNVGLIVTTSTVAPCGSSTIPAGSDNTTPTGLKFRVAGNGTTTVDASAATLITTDAGSVDVTVTGFSLALLNNTAENNIGSGLQQGTFFARRPSSNTSNPATITVTTLTPSICLVSSSGTVAGSTSTTVSIPAGATDSTTFWIQGLENVIATCRIQTVGAYYTPGPDLVVSIVRPGLRIGLPATYPYNAVNLAFNVMVGSATGTTFGTEQSVRIGGVAFDVTVTLTDNGSGGPFAQLVSSISPSPAAVVHATIPPGSSRNTTTLEFDPLATGYTTGSCTTPTATATTQATQQVQVTNSGC